MCHDGKGRLTYFPWFSDFALYLDTQLVYFLTRGPVTGLYGEKNRRKWSDFALCNLEREVDFALFFSDFKTLLSILITVIHSFDCLQLSNNASFRHSVANGDTADCQVTLNESMTTHRQTTGRHDNSPTANIHRQPTHRHDC